MTYFVQARKLHKDLYIKKTLTTQHSTTPWIPKQDIRVTSIDMIVLNTAPSGSGNTVIRVYKDRTLSSEETLFTGTFSAGETEEATTSTFSKKITAGSRITYSIVSEAAGNPGEYCLIRFTYENI